jgi:3-methyladenine DNA glycosylase AlkD
MNTKASPSNKTKLATYVAAELKLLGDSRKAVEMAAYMKTTMPFYGVQKPDRIPIIRHLKLQYKPTSLKQYKENIACLWQQPHREEKYIAINYAELFPEYVSEDSIPLYERMIREGAWWDFVDAISTNLVGEAYLKELDTLRPIMEKWSQDKDMWIRRASILSHLYHKKDTDHEFLFGLCAKLAHEKEFFIQKGIGWALREYSKTNPKAVKKFLREKKRILAPLSYREGAKHLLRTETI